MLHFLSQNLDKFCDEHEMQYDSAYMTPAFTVILNVLEHKSFDVTKKENIVIFKAIKDYMLYESPSPWMINGEADECWDQLLEILAIIHNAGIQIDLKDTSIIRKLANIVTKADDPALVLKIDLNLLCNEIIQDPFSSKAYAYDGGISFRSLIPKNDV